MAGLTAWWRVFAEAGWTRLSVSSPWQGVVSLAHKLIHGRIGRFVNALFVGEYGIDWDAAARADHAMSKFSANRMDRAA